jgi:hypothetical protein
MVPVQGWVVEVAPLDVPAHQVTQGEEEIGDGRRLDGLPHVHTHAPAGRGHGGVDAKQQKGRRPHGRGGHWLDTSGQKAELANPLSAATFFRLTPFDLHLECK